MLEFDIDTEEFNQITSRIMSEEVEKWAENLKFIKINKEKNAELIGHTNHYRMLLDALEQSKTKVPNVFFYKKDDPKEVREEAITDFARKTAFPSYKRKIAKDILNSIIGKYDKENNPEKGFNNFVNTFFLNVKINDYLYENSKEFKDFSDEINDLKTLDKFYQARDDKEYQKKVESVFVKERMDMIIKDPLFIDTCILMKDAGVFHTNQQVVKA